MFNFDVRQLNSAFDDSAFFIRNVYHKRAMLLDCGRISNMNHSEILSLGDIFVSHTHIDHFYGFDRIIRSTLCADQTLTVYGPEGFIDNVNGKLHGYTWNLVDDYNFTVKAIELSASTKQKIALFKAKNKFDPEFIVEDISAKDVSSLFERSSKYSPASIGDDFLLEYEFFEHRIPSVGYRISEPIHFAVDKEKLDQFGEKAGQWLAKLKIALQNDDYSAEINVNDKIFKVAELKDKLIEIKSPQSITYITDCAPTSENIERAVAFAKNSTLLIIEAVFVDEDEEHAINKQHLTIGKAKEIFARSGSESVRFSHFSTRYEMDKATFIKKLYDNIGDKIYHPARNQ